MTEHAADFDDDDLLRQLGWVRRLAVELVREPAAADDIVQDVARVALEKRASFTGDERGFRAWLAAVARRIAVDRARSDRARRGRERSTARSEADDSAASIEERSARARIVADAVHSLPEPYRATVLHRYFDELSIAEVAARTGVDEATARKRLSRARTLLRERLERGGDPSHAWLASIAGVGFERGGALTTAVASSATTAVAVGGLAMSMKLVLGAAAACVLVAIWFVARPDSGVLESAQVETRAASAVELADVAPAAEDSAPAAPAPRADRSSAVVTTSAPDPAVAHDGPVLRVRVVDTQERAVADGLLCVFPDRMSVIQVRGATRPSLTAPIAGAITDVALPAGTKSALITASSADPISSRPTALSDLKDCELRELTLEVGRALEKPAISGRILVDGVPRVPRGLSIQILSGGTLGAFGLVHAVAGTWAVEGVPVKDPTIVVTSDETVFQRCVPTDEALASGRLDLELVTGRTLVVKLLDRVTGRPHADATFVLRTDIPIDARVWDARMRVLRTDGSGTCRTTGIPLRGSFALEPDLDPVRRGMVFNNMVASMSTHFASEPWISRRVTESDPPIVEVELRVDIPAPGGSAFGFVPAHLLSAIEAKKARLVSAEVTDFDPDGGDLFEVPRDDAGRWTLTSHWPSRHSVWIQDISTRAALTEKAEVVLDGPREVGPIDLIPAGGANVELSIRGVPELARVSLMILEDGEKPRSESPAVRDGASNHSFALSKPANLQVSYSLRGADGAKSTEITRILRVDPRNGRSFAVDFAAGPARSIVFAPSGEALPDTLRLVFMRFSPDDPAPTEALVMSAADLAVSTGEHLTPGRWTWSCIDTTANVAVGGVVEVDDAATEIRLAPRVVRRTRDELGKGITWEELDGVDLKSIDARVRQQRFEFPGDVLMREDGRWSQLP